MAKNRKALTPPLSPSKRKSAGKRRSSISLIKSPKELTQSVLKALTKKNTEATLIALTPVSAQDIALAPKASTPSTDFRAITKVVAQCAPNTEEKFEFLLSSDSKDLLENEAATPGIDDAFFPNSGENPESGEHYMPITLTEFPLEKQNSSDRYDQFEQKCTDSLESALMQDHLSLIPAISACSWAHLKQKSDLSL